MAQRKDNRLNGINPLSYLGVELSYPPNVAIYKRVPTSKDKKNLNIGSIWIDASQTPADVWMFVSLSAGVATWTKVAEGSSAAAVFQTDSGSASPIAGVLNIVGDGSPITTSGTGNTVTILMDGTIASTFDTDVSSCQPSGGELEVTGGTAVSTSGSGDTLTINIDEEVSTTYTTGSGSAIPAANSIKFAGGTNVTTSAAGDTITIDASGISGGPLDVSFLAYQATDGGSPAATGVFLGAAVVMTEVYDAGSDFTVGDGIGTSAKFTAPQNGKYFLQMQIRFQRVGGAAVATINNYIELQTSNRTYRDSGEIAYTGATSSFERTMIITVVADMDLGDTAEYFGLVNDVPATFDIKGNVSVTGEYETFVSGALADTDTTCFTEHAVLVGNSAGGIGELPLADDGQVLIGATGAASEWANIIAGANVTITEGPNTLEIASAGGSGPGASISSFFAYQKGVSGVYNTSSYTTYFGIAEALIELFDTGNNFYPGNGSSLPAQFVAPQSGIYMFNIQSSIFVGSLNPFVPISGNAQCQLFLETPSGPISEYSTIWFYELVEQIEYINQSLNVLVELSLGDVVKAKVSYAKSFGSGEISELSAGVLTASAETFFSGTLV